MQAIESKNRSTAEWLLNNGVSPFITNNMGQTPLHIAKLMRNQDLIELINNFL